MRLSYQIQTPDGLVLRAGHSKPPVPRLYRYLPIEYSREFVDRGRVRISRSTTLNDDKLSAGQRDAENRKSLVLHASGVTLPDRADPRIVSRVTELGSERRESFELEAELTSDYYLLCLSSDLRADLFDEFPPADAVVEIFNVARFAKAMRRASLRTFGGRGREVWMTHQPVRYMDEILGYGTSMLTMSPCFDKHTDYANQKEHRFTWYPCIFDDEYVFLDCGSLASMARVIRREQVESGEVEEVIVDYRTLQDAANAALEDEDVTSEVKWYRPPGADR